MANAFKDTMKDLFHEAPNELVKGFKGKLKFIQQRYKHSHTTVQSCLDGMVEKPSLAELLAAAYLINGGITFKYEDNDDGPGATGDGCDLEFTELIREMDELNGLTGDNQNKETTNQD